MTTLEKLEKLIYQGFKETEQRFKDTDRQFKEALEQIKQNDKKWAALKEDFFGLSKSVGLFAENMVKPAVGRLFHDRGIVLTGFYSRASERRNGGTMEVDVLGVGPEHVIAIEVKFKLELEDVKEFLEHLPDFFDYFQHYRGLTLYGAVAGMSIDKGVDRYAYKKGLFVLAQSGENILILNDRKFVPRAYAYPAQP
jgi:hypothetical protein